MFQLLFIFLGWDGKLLPESKDSIDNMVEVIKNKLSTSKNCKFLADFIKVHQFSYKVFSLVGRNHNYLWPTLKIDNRGKLWGSGGWGF